MYQPSNLNKNRNHSRFSTANNFHTKKPWDIPTISHPQTTFRPSYTKAQMHQAITQIRSHQAIIKTPERLHPEHFNYPIRPRPNNWKRPRAFSTPANNNSPKTSFRERTSFIHFFYYLIPTRLSRIKNKKLDFWMPDESKSRSCPGERGLKKLVLPF